MQCKLWAKAAEHSHGSGLELGPTSFCAARKAITYFKKRGLYSAAKAVEYSVVGFSVTLQKKTSLPLHFATGAENVPEQPGFIAFLNA